MVQIFKSRCLSSIFGTVVIPSCTFLSSIAVAENAKIILEKMEEASKACDQAVYIINMRSETRRDGRLLKEPASTQSSGDSSLEIFICRSDFPRLDIMQLKPRSDVASTLANPSLAMHRVIIKNGLWLTVNAPGVAGGGLVSLQTGQQYHLGQSELYANTINIYLNGGGCLDGMVVRAA